jgi:predicted ATPase
MDLSYVDWYLVKRYVLTGGHGVGKTSLLLGLEQRGERIVREVGSDYQRYRRACGTPFPTDEPGFEAAVLTIQLRREAHVTDWQASRIFFDRGAPDAIAYGQEFGWVLPGELIAAGMAARYDAVFMVEPGDEYGVRLRPAAEQIESERVARALIRVYEQLGCPLYSVPSRSVEERVDIVLDIVHALERGESVPPASSTINP